MAHPLPLEIIEASIAARAQRVRINPARPLTDRQAYALRLVQDRPRQTRELVNAIGGCSAEGIATLAGLLARNKIELSNGFWWSVKEKERAA